MKTRADFFEFAGLHGVQGVGLELGVASGGFLYLAEKHTSPELKLIGVDSWEGERGLIEYRNALLLCDPAKTRLVRMTESQAAALFGPGHFDFIYVDLFAHEAEKLPEVLERWYPKLKPDGILAGDDYCRKDFPKVCDAVDAFAKAHGKYAAVFEYTPETDVYSQHPSWVLFDMPF